MVDSGSHLNCIRYDFLKTLMKQKDIKMEPSYLQNVIGVCGEVHSVMGTITLELTHKQHAILLTFHVFKRLHYNAILGLPFLTGQKATIDFDEQTLSLPLIESTLPFTTKINCIGHGHTVGKVKIPARSEALLPLKVTTTQPDEVILAFLEPSPSLSKTYPIIGSKAVVIINKGACFYRLMNPTKRPVTIKADTKLSLVTPLEAYNVYPFLDPNDKDSQQPTACSSLATEQSNSNIDLSQHSEPHGMSDDHYIQLAKELDIDFSNSTLTESQQRQLMILIGKYRKAFAKDLSEIGLTRCVQHYIDMQHNVPKRFPPYRTTPQKQRAIEQELNKLESADIIEPCVSEWASPLIILEKRNQPGNYRIVIDYKYVNSCTKPKFFPLPTLDNIIDTVGHVQPTIFSTLDLRQGFFQIPMAEESKDYTAFSTHLGTYRFKKMPQGLHSSPSTYSLAMSEVFRGLNYRTTCIYADDILVSSSSFERHLEDLSMCLDRLIQHGLTLNPSKCSFGKPEVHFLGHILTSQGLMTDPKKVAAISATPVPQNKKPLKSFLGLASYYRRFVRSFGAICHPLYHLLKEDVEYVWDGKCQTAFDKIKSRLETAPILHYPDFSKPFKIETDASDIGIGMVLLQTDSEGIERVISFASRTLRPCEKKWSISEKECLAIVTAVKLWHCYLASQKFVIQTDHIALKYIHKLKDGNSRLYRWSLILQPYHFTIQYKPGKLNVVADHLSRTELPKEAQIPHIDLDSHFDYPVSSLDTSDCEPCEASIEFELDQSEQFSFMLPVNAIDIDTDNTSDPTPDYITPDNIAALQRSCDELRPIIDYLESDTLPADGRKAKAITHSADQYAILNNGILYHYFSPRSKGIPKSRRYIRQLAVPKVLRREVIENYHSMSHYGFDRCYQSIRQHYWWPRQYADVFDYVTSCDECQKAKIQTHKHTTPLTPLPIVPTFHRWQMDLLGPFPPSHPEKYRYILLVVESRTKWPEAIPLRSKETKEVASALYTHIFTRYGSAHTLLSDNGREFLSKICHCLCQLFRVKRINTTPYRPECNSLCERTNRVIGDNLRCLVNTKQDNWADVIPSLMMAYRKTPHSATGYAPFTLLFGREMRAPIDVGLVPTEEVPKSTKEYIQNVIDNLKTAHEISQINLEHAQERYKSYHDRNAREVKFQIGQKVLKNNFKVLPGKARKLTPKWVGPYIVIESFDNNTYKLQDCQTHKILRSRINANRLRPYKDRKDLPDYLYSDQLPLNTTSATGDNASRQATQVSDNQQADTTQPQGPQSNGPQQTTVQPSTSTDTTPEAAKIMKASRYKSKVWYLVKFEDGHTQWTIEDDVADGLKNQFHAKYTFSGRVRRKSKRAALLRK